MQLHGFMQICTRVTAKLGQLRARRRRECQNRPPKLRFYRDSKNAGGISTGSCELMKGTPGFLMHLRGGGSKTGSSD